MGRKISNGVTQDGLVSVSVTSNTVSTVITNDNLLLSPNGTGEIRATAPFQLNATNELRFADSDSSNYVGFKSPTTVATNRIWTLPAADGTSGYALSTNGSGTLSWSAVGPVHDVEVSSSSTFYPVFTTQATAGYLTATRVANATRVLSYQPSTGTLSSQVFTETSSIALKENFNPIENALDLILQLQGWIYDRKDGSIKDEAGLIAEDVNKIIPNLVTKDADGNPETIAYTRLTAYLIEAVKTLKQEINELKGI